MAQRKSKIEQHAVAIPEVVGEITSTILDSLSRWISSESLYKAQERGLISIHENKVRYVVQGKAYRATDPEESVRLAFYLELIDRYQYPPERIDFEVEVPGRTPDVQADIVVFEDDIHKKPFVVVECKKDGIPPAEIAQADKQAIGNANALRSKYCILVAGTIRIARDVAGFAQDEREKNIIADIPIRYGKVIKFRYTKGDPLWDLKDVTKDELLAKFQQCHDALWEGGKRNPAEAFDEMSKLMYCKIQDERFLTKKGDHYLLQVGTHETVNDVSERIKEIYKKAQSIDKEVFVEPIKADNAVIYTVAEILQGISLSRTGLDVKGEGYEHFLGGVFRGAMGQYFTPRSIVSFMVDFLQPTINDFIIDPACGSGGFLIHTLEKMRKELHERLDEKDADYRWQDFALKQVHGIEINSQLSRVSMMNMIIHEDGHTNIENADALDDPASWKRQRIREYFGREFNLLLTNPPFGASVREREKAYLADYELGGKVRKRNRQNTEILFIERCLDFLKPGGRMGILLPDGILTNSTLQYARDFILERAQVLAVVSLPEAAFKRPSSKGSGDTGSGVKASILFLRKKKTGETLRGDYAIFMAIAEHVGYSATGRPDSDEFPGILNSWNHFCKTNSTDFLARAPLCFAIGRAALEGKLNPKFYNPEYLTTLAQLHKSAYPLKKLKEIARCLVDGPFGSQLKVAEYVSHGIPLIRVKDIKNENVEISDLVFITPQKQNQLKRSRVVPGDVLLTKAGSLGNAAVFPLHLNEGNITSHLAKIEVDQKEIKPQYLSAFLNSKLGQSQIFRWGNKSTRPELNLQEVGEILIPLPPLGIQERVSEELRSSREIALKLREEAAAVLLKAKEKVEKMILGEETSKP